MKDTERFLMKTEPHGDCLEWVGYKQSNGYGQFRFKGKAHYAHRVSYILFRGEIPKGKVVMHSCDNRWCVNPNHLTLGTQSDNLQDMAVKGRHHKVVIPNDKIKDIRNDQRSASAIAKEWGVCRSTIQKIKSGINRRYV